MDETYYNKYLKYKTKYFKLKYDYVGFGLDESHKTIFSLIDDFDKKYSSINFNINFKLGSFYLNIMKPKIDEKLKSSSNGLMKKNNLIVKLKEEFIEKSPQEIYTWWLRKAQENFNSHTWNIGEEFSILYINQVIYIINYFIENTPTTKFNKAKQDIFENYFKLLNSFYEKKDSSIYGKTFDIQIAYLRLVVEFMQDGKILHLIGKNVNEAIRIIKSKYDKLSNLPFIYMPTSYVFNESNMNKFYSVPIIPYIGIKTMVHAIDNIKWIIHHDINIHLRLEDRDYNKLFKGKSLDSYIKFYYPRMVFFQKIHELEDKLLDLLIFDIIHEGSLNLTYRQILNKKIHIFPVSFETKLDPYIENIYDFFKYCIENDLGKYYSSFDHFSKSNLSKILNIDFHSFTDEEYIKILLDKLELLLIIIEKTNKETINEKIINEEIRCLIHNDEKSCYKNGCFFNKLDKICKPSYKYVLKYTK
jgi:hypothetical protein